MSKPAAGGSIKKETSRMNEKTNSDSRDSDQKQQIWVKKEGHDAALHGARSQKQQKFILAKPAVTTPTRWMIGRSMLLSCCKTPRSHLR